MKVLYTIIALVSLSNVFAQGRLMISNAYVVVDNSAKLVIENSATNAITNSGTGGIMTESEFDQVVWMIGTNTGAYVMPFVSQAAITQIPFTATINTAGAGSGTIRFSTYPGPVSDNFVYKPSDVTHMFDYNTNSINNSSHVIDRFWIIDALGYTTKPSATFDFTYRDIEHSVASNTIVEADLGAQRFNSTTNQWGDYLPQGTTNTVANTTTGVPVIPADFFRSWTLSEITNPLAVDLAYFKGNCTNQGVAFNWQTLVESNVDHFDIERYTNSTFEWIGSVGASGGIGPHDYVFETTNYRNGIFKLMEVTTDGIAIEKSTLSMNCSASDVPVIHFDPVTNSLFMQFSGLENGIETLELFDASGRIVFQTQVAISSGVNTINFDQLDLSKGLYALRLKNGINYIQEKIVKPL